MRDGKIRQPIPAAAARGPVSSAIRAVFRDGIPTANDDDALRGRGRGVAEAIRRRARQVIARAPAAAANDA